MQGVRLAVGVADAIPYPAPAPDADSGAGEDAPPTSGEAFPTGDPPPRRTGLRGAVSAWLRRPAEYARAYLTATLAHSFQLQAVRVTEIAGRAQRLEANDARLAAILAKALTEVRGLALRLDDLERRQGAQGEALKRLQTVAGHQTDQLDTAIGILGPRFDELEIKARPLIPFDQDSWAVRVADGYLMLPRAEAVFTVMVANAGSGGLEPGVRRVLQALLPPGGRAADVGANVGLLTLAMARAVGPGGRVWAFEPEARSRRQLEKTLHLNGLAQVALSEAAVSAEAGRLTFHESPVIGHSSLYALPDVEEAAATLVEVPVVRLDDVVPEDERLDLVKIDVEGAELDVLRGMERLLRANPDLAVVAEYGPSHLARVGIAPADWFAAFAVHGLEPRLIGEPDGATAATGAQALAGVESANLVFVRPGGRADGRLPR